MDQLMEKLAKALSLGGDQYTLPDVADAITTGTARLWADDKGKGVIVAYIHSYPQARVLYFWLVAGEQQAVLDLEEQVMAWGREEGCSHAEAQGRRGWTRVLSKRGWTALPTVTYVKEL